MNADPNTASATSAGLRMEIDGHPYRLELTPHQGNTWLATLDGQPLPIDVRLTQPGVLSLLIHGQSFRCVLEEGPLETAIHVAGHRYLLTIDDPRSLTARRRKAGASGGQQVIKAPMPGKIVRTLVHPGDLVQAQQGIVVIEAMKMQNELKATRAGKVIELKTEAGATVAAGAVLAILE